MTLKINRINIKELTSIRIQIPDSKKYLETPMDEPLDTKIEALNKDELLYNLRDLQRLILKLQKNEASIEFDLEEK